jgi:hypothetical protein
MNPTREATMSENNQTKPIAKTLTSYRRWILKVYNTKPKTMSDAEFCKRHRIKVQGLCVWQRLAGQELELRLKEMRAVEETVVNVKEKSRIPFDRRAFVHECARVIELTAGGRVQDEMAHTKSFYRCELARYRLLQIIASLPSSDRNYRRFTRQRCTIKYVCFCGTVEATG